MALVKLNTRGLSAPHPILKIAAMIPQLSEGDILEVEADCAAFDEEVRAWCARMNKLLTPVRVQEGVTVVQIQF